MIHVTTYQLINITINQSFNFSVILDTSEYIKLETKPYFYLENLPPILIDSNIPVSQHKLLTFFIGTNIHDKIDDLDSIFIQNKWPIYQATNLPRSIGHSYGSPEPSQIDRGNSTDVWINSPDNSRQSPALIHR